MKKRMLYRFLLAGLIVIVTAGCSATELPPSLIQQDSAIQNADSGDALASAGNEATHGNKSDPNYDVVFPQDSVNRIDINLSSEAWTDLQTALAEQFGGQGSGNQGLDNPGRMPGGPGNNQQPPSNQQIPEANPPDQQPAERPAGQAPENGNIGDLDFGDTEYVSSTITFQGETWESVGFRYSGNSTLQSSWKSGTEKISFRLDFDEFDEVDPSTTNQRFYGFKQLSFKSNAKDDSYLREKVTGDIFREAGVAAPQTAFYEVYVDYGDGSKYLGVFTAVEIVDDTVIKTQFADDSGNVYKPEGSGAAFVKGTFNTESFEKQTNEDEADWSDIEAIFEALHSELRTSDPASWRANLEAVFDVDAFIRWLAVDTIIQNWDTYGAMAHNYYLYTDPTDGLVTWIPWDNNEALSAKSEGPGTGNRGGQGRGVRDLGLTGVSEQWPLIRYLMDDPTYLTKYQQYLEETIQGAFQPEKLEATYTKYHDLIAPYVQKEEEGYTQLGSIEGFNQSVNVLTQHAKDRSSAVAAYLAAK